MRYSTRNELRASSAHFAFFGGRICVNDHNAVFRSKVKTRRDGTGVCILLPDQHLMENSGLPNQDMLIQAKCLQREQSPHDLVGTVVFLASSDSDFISAQVLNVDGGWMTT